MAHLRSCLVLLCLPTAALLANGAGAQGVAPAAPFGGVAPAAPVGGVAPAAPVGGMAPAAPAGAAAPAPPPVPAPASPPGPIADTEGDRADAIARDSVLHPPRRPDAQGPARLETIELKLGGLLDRSVHGTENSEVGRVIDVLVGDDGRPAALELDVGGFMGVGNRKIAVAWALFDVAKPGTEPLRVALTEGQVRSAPAAEGSGAIALVTGVGGPAAGPAEARAPAAGARPAATPARAAPAAVPADGPSPAPPGVPALGLTLSPVPVPPVVAPPPAVGAAAPRSHDAARDADRNPSAPAASTAGPLPRRTAPPSGRR